MREKVYAAIKFKSFYSSVECVEQGLKDGTTVKERIGPLFYGKLQRP